MDCADHCLTLPPSLCPESFPPNSFPRGWVEWKAGGDLLTADVLFLGFRPMQESPRPVYSSCCSNQLKPCSLDVPVLFFSFWSLLPCFSGLPAILLLHGREEGRQDNLTSCFVFQTEPCSYMEQFLLWFLSYHSTITAVICTACYTLAY